MKMRNINLYLLSLLIAVTGTQLFAAKTEVQPVAKQERGEITSRFRVGPFFEYRATDRNEFFWAIRPFYSYMSDPNTDTEVSDFVWPISTWHRLHNQTWWRFALAYGSDDDITNDDAGWKTALFPLYFQGKDRLNKEYWALFPIYGHFPHILLMDDVEFALFPLYLKYSVNGKENRFHPWPFYSRQKPDAQIKKFGVFPIYGGREQEKGNYYYTLWPIWTSTTYFHDRNPGESWMLWPIYGRVNRKREQQHLFLPPFFSYVKTNREERWRMPWPFYETLHSETQDKRSYWPFYGYSDREDEHSWYALWPLLGGFSLETEEHKTERNRFFPFYLNQKIWHTPITQENRRAPKVRGETYLEEDYTRLWPFFSYVKTPTRSRFRLFDFTLIRYSAAVERNWSAFWTLYERVETEKSISHDFLWGLLKFKSEKEKKNKE